MKNEKRKKRLDMFMFQLCTLWELGLMMHFSHSLLFFSFLLILSFHWNECLAYLIIIIIVLLELDWFYVIKTNLMLCWSQIAILLYKTSDHIAKRVSFVVIFRETEDRTRNKKKIKELWRERHIIINVNWPDFFPFSSWSISSFAYVRSKERIWNTE